MREAKGKRRGGRTIVGPHQHFQQIDTYVRKHGNTPLFAKKIAVSVYKETQMPTTCDLQLMLI